MKLPNIQRSLGTLLAISALLGGGAGTAAAGDPPALAVDFALHRVPSDDSLEQPQARSETYGAYGRPAAGEPPPLAPSSLSGETLTVRAGDRIEDLLRARRIEPDGDALGAVYLMNQDLRNVSELEPGTRLNLPRFAGELRPAERVRLELVPETRADLRATTRALETLALRLPEVPAERLGAPDEREEVVGAVDEILGYLGELHRRIEGGEMPISPELLAQSLAGARAAGEALEPVLKPGGALGARERRLLVGVSEDLNLKSRNFDMLDAQGVPMRWRDVRVVVQVVRTPGLDPVPGLRIFYVQEALADVPEAFRPFPGLSPDAAKRLIEADYVFWAAEAGDPRPRTDRLKQAVRQGQGEPMELKLVALPSPGGP